MLRSVVMRRLVAWTLTAACAGGAQQVGVQPSWRGSAAVAPAAASGPQRVPVASSIRFSPASEPARRYNDPRRDPPHTPLGDAVIAAVTSAATQAGVRPPVADARLFRACADLAEIASADGVIDYALIEFALQRNGIVEPTPRLLVLWNVIDSPQAITQQLQPRLAEMLASGGRLSIGVGVSAARRGADGTGPIVFAVQESGVSTSPIPRAVEAGGTISIEGALDPPYHDPEVLVTRDDGGTEQLALKPARAGGFASQIACGTHQGRQQIEIGASDAAGPTVLANFPVWCGGAPPASITINTAHDDAPPATTEAAERGLVARLNRDRAAAGIPVLTWDDQLAQVARAHSEEMRRTHIVAHVSPSTGSVADRIRAAHIRTALVLENLARAYGVDEAHQALMNSPGHRANMMSSAATHVGIGVTFGDGAEPSGRHEMFVTQLFMRVTPKLEPAIALDVVRRRLAATRPTLVFVPTLQGFAQTVAEQLAAGRSRDQAFAAVQEPLTRLGRTYQRVGQVIEVLGDLDSLDPAGLLASVSGSDLGIGIAQGPHAEIGDNAIWLVVLTAQRRTTP
jgi:uncharacterized protein YkwD